MSKAAGVCDQPEQGCCIGAGFFWKMPGFSCKTQDFSANSWKNAGRFQGTSDPTSSTSDRDLSYPKNVPMFIHYTEIWRVGAPEGREKYLTTLKATFFCKLKKVVFLAEDYGINQIFL